MTNEEIRELRDAADLLGVGYTIDSQSIKKAYKEFVHAWHPDAASKRGIDPQQANEKMVAGNKAHKLLKDAVASHGEGYAIPEETKPSGGAQWQGTASSTTSSTNTSATSSATAGSTRQTTQNTSTGWEDYSTQYGSSSSTAWSTPSSQTTSQATSQTSGATTYTPGTFSRVSDYIHSVVEPTSDVPFKEATAGAKFLRIVIHGFGWFLAALLGYTLIDFLFPLDNMTYVGILDRLFSNILQLPSLVFLIILVVGGVWGYRKFARFVIGLSDYSSGGYSFRLGLGALVVIAGIMWWSHPVVLGTIREALSLFGIVL